MSFLSKLGKIGGLVGGGLATAFTGGAAAPLLGAALGIGGKVAGDLAASRGQGRVDELNANLSVADRRERDMINRADLDLQRRNFAGQEQRRRLSDVMRGDMLANFNPTSAARPDGVPMMKFGSALNASMLGPNSRQGGDAFSRMALEKLLAGGDQFEDVPMQDYDALTPKAGLLDKILAIAGPAASISSGIMGSIQPRSKAVASLPNPVQSSTDAAFRKIRF